MRHVILEVTAPACLGDWAEVTQRSGKEHKHKPSVSSLCELDTQQPWPKPSLCPGLGWGLSACHRLAGHPLARSASSELVQHPDTLSEPVQTPGSAAESCRGAGKSSGQQHLHCSNTTCTTGSFIWERRQPASTALGFAAGTKRLLLKTLKASALGQAGWQEGLQAGVALILL